MIALFIRISILTSSSSWYRSKTRYQLLLFSLWNLP